MLSSVGNRLLEQSSFAPFFLILFPRATLLLPHISKGIKRKIFHCAYCYICCQNNAWEFIATRESNQKYYTDFKKVKKIVWRRQNQYSWTKIAFSHPSYHEAFQYAIDSKEHYSDRRRDIFVEVLLRLVHKDEAALGVAYAITKNFDKLPDNAQQPLFKLSDKDNQNHYYSVIGKSACAL